MGFITNDNAAKIGRPFDSVTGAVAGKIGGSRPKPKRVGPIMTDEEKTRQNVINRQLRLVREQITRARERLNDDRLDYCEHCNRGGMPDHHRAQLLKALDSLLERECDLFGVPGRGKRRPAPERQQRKAYSVLPPPEPIAIPQPSQ